jgi:hypothetical protein
LFELARITYIYWAIDCTPIPSFVGLFKLAKITYIFEAIECTPKP